MLTPIHAGNSARKVTTYAILGFFIGTIIIGASGSFVPDKIEPSGNVGSLSRFSSYDELKKFIQVLPEHGFYYYPSNAKGGFNFLSDVAMSATVEEGGTSDYSTTNIQVEGVDEADLVKTDGEYIYLVSREQVYILRAYPPEEARIVSTITMEKYIIDLYIGGDKLVILGVEDVFLARPLSIPEDAWGAATFIDVYDIKDRANPILDRSATLDGYYLNSRLIDDYVYMVTSQFCIRYNDSEVYLPHFKDGDKVYEVEADTIYYNNNTDSWCSFTNIFALNIQQPGEPLGHESFLLGLDSIMYASQDTIYLASICWDKEIGDATKVFKVNVEGRRIEYTADGIVPGFVLNQFSIDEHKGYLRIATTQGHISRTTGGTNNNIYVLSKDLEIVGRIEGLAPGEKIYSARFIGERCYLVTFKKVDPLFTIDLSDPRNPRILGKLKIPGYSDYLHPYDENHLIGIGKETVEAEEGDFAWYQGVKITLFDVSDVENPREVSKIVIGKRGTETPALHDHKAVLFSKPHNLLIIPILVAEIDPNKFSGDVPPNFHGEYVYQGAHVFHISSEAGIQLRGRITHIEDFESFVKSGYWFEDELEVQRSLYINEVLYTISQGMIKMNALDNLSNLGLLELS